MKGKFLYVKYIGKPRDPSQSAKKGYLKENMAWDEQVSLSTKLTDKEILEASIVIDLENRTLKINNYEYYKKNKLSDHV